jgi:dCTP diphosphatase
MSNPEASSELEHLRDTLRVFVAERDWQRFHTPKNLASALCVEAAELLELFQWLETGRGEELDQAATARVADELADVLICAIRLADETGIDLRRATRDKIEKNRRKYPPDKVRGSARKYSDY